jgi:hypothetical protein
MAPFADRQRCVGGAHFLQLCLDAMARDADRRDSLALAHISDGFRQLLDKTR